MSPQTLDLFWCEPEVQHWPVRTPIQRLRLRNGQPSRSGQCFGCPRRLSNAAAAQTAHGWRAQETVPEATWFKKWIKMNQNDKFWTNGWSHQVEISQSAYEAWQLGDDGSTLHLLQVGWKLFTSGFSHLHWIELKISMTTGTTGWDVPQVVQLRRKNSQVGFAGPPWQVQWDPWSEGSGSEPTSPLSFLQTGLKLKWLQAWRQTSQIIK